MAGDPNPRDSLARNTRLCRGERPHQNLYPRLGSLLGLLEKDACGLIVDVLFAAVLADLSGNGFDHEYHVWSLKCDSHMR